VVPGGALEAGETHRAAAARELMEETELSAEIGRELWSRDFELDTADGMVHQQERYFLVNLTAIALAVRNISSEPIQEHRWWTLSELRATAEVVYPEGLAGAISDIVENRVDREDPR